MLHLKKWKLSSPVVVSQPKEVLAMDKQQEYAELMKAKCIREAHKAATNLEIEKAQTLYHEARVWENVSQELQYGYRIAA